jgi:carbon-monoxide dehydrogenase medium subunit
MWKHYYCVETVDEALTLLQQHGESARIIAGGTDILIELERRQRSQVDTLIDISRVAGLREISLVDDVIRLGALVTHNQVVASDLLRERALPLVQAAWEVGAPQIRNRATIAGNLITASPANDTICPLLALDASVRLISRDGERVIPLREFYTGLRRTVMRPDEIMTAIDIPPMSDRTHGVFLKLGLRRAQAISVVNVTAVVQFDDDQVIHAAIALGSVAPTVVRVPEAEAVLVGKPLNAESIAAAANAAAEALTPITDVRSTAAYRSEMIRVFIARALRTLQDVPAYTLNNNRLPENPAMLWGAETTTEVPSIAYSPGQPIETVVNGVPMTLHTGDHRTLLHFLREDVGLPGTKEGCSEGECGACTVFLNGIAVMACMVAAPRAHGAEIVTVEGLKTDEALHPIQEAFIEHGAVQCGYCTPGFLMAGAKLLEEHPKPTPAQIQQSISGNLCRCTGYYKIVQAFHAASEKHTQQENEAL